MSRSQRLLEILQILRQHRYPLKGERLALKVNVSLRTLYRDIKTLQRQGAPIAGEAGVGYVLQPGYLLPPLMFSHEEIEAMVLGMRWVEKKGDQQLKHAAIRALSKISAVLPEDLKSQLENSSLLVGPGEVINSSEIDLTVIRQAIRNQHKTYITYQNQEERQSSRIIWPFALAFFDNVRIVVAWCETRQAFRHFRYDRLISFSSLQIRYPKSRLSLLNEWRQQEGISTPEI